MFPLFYLIKLRLLRYPPETALSTQRCFELIDSKNGNILAAIFSVRHNYKQKVSPRWAVIKCWPTYELTALLFRSLFPLIKLKGVWRLVRTNQKLKSSQLLHKFMSKLISTKNNHHNNSVEIGHAYSLVFIHQSFPLQTVFWDLIILREQLVQSLYYYYQWTQLKPQKPPT